MKFTFEKKKKHTYFDNLSTKQETPVWACLNRSEKE